MPITNPKWADRWQAECQHAAFHAANLIKLAGQHPSGWAIAELIRTVPKAPDERFDADCYFARSVLDANQNASGNETDIIRRALDYLEQFAAMRPARRIMLEACLTGAFLGHAVRI
jgi:hypothetical protein